MLVEAERVPDGSWLRTDLCVVGAGAAGISLARELAGGPFDVVVLESGGLESDPSAQELNAGEIAGLPYFALDETRFRRFGGSTHRWAGWCRELDPIDFETRDWVPFSGWPFGHATLAPYYRRAAEICQIAATPGGVAAWGDAVPELYRSPFVGGEIRAVSWRSSPPTKFGDVYRQDLAAAHNVRVLLHSTAVELETNAAGGRVQAVHVAGGDGRRFRVEAQRVVLTAGALESARLLLTSRGVRPEGLGNDHGLVGRFFADHPHVVSGRIRIARPASTGRPPVAALDLGLRGAGARFRLRRPVPGAKFGYALAEDSLRRRGLLSLSAHLVPERTAAAADLQHSLALVASNLRSPRRLLAQARAGALPEGWSDHVSTLARHPGAVLEALYAEILRRPAALGLYSQAEQAPNPDSRVTLSDEKDRFGVPRLRLEWRLGRLDHDSLRAGQAVIGAQLAQAGLGELEPAGWLAEGGEPRWGTDLTGGHHQLGTTRMSRDPKRGVVDGDGRVHGMANLYVADGGVFPTVGFANPLLTIVALALRCADHLRATA